MPPRAPRCLAITPALSILACPHGMLPRRPTGRSSSLSQATLIPVWAHLPVAAPRPLTLLRQPSWLGLPSAVLPKHRPRFPGLPASPLLPRFRWGPRRAYTRLPTTAPFCMPIIPAPTPGQLPVCHHTRPTITKLPLTTITPTRQAARRALFRHLTQRRLQLPMFNPPAR